MSTKSLVASDKQVLDFEKMVSLTNRSQAICLVLGDDALVPAQAREYYKQANELMIKAMRCSIPTR